MVAILLRVLCDGLVIQEVDIFKPLDGVCGHESRPRGLEVVVKPTYLFFNFAMNFQFTKKILKLA